MKKYNQVLVQFPSIADVFQNRIAQDKKCDENKEISGDSTVVKKDTLAMNDLVPYSLFIFSRKNPFRQLMVKIVTSKTFEGIMTGLIILNSIILGINDYNDNNPSTWRDDLMLY